jgi:hypothetical protein
MRTSSIDELIRKQRCGGFYIGQPLAEVRALFPSALNPTGLWMPARGISEKGGLFNLGNIELHLTGEKSDTLKVYLIVARPSDEKRGLIIDLESGGVRVGSDIAVCLKALECYDPILDKEKTFSDVITYSLLKRTSAIFHRDGNSASFYQFETK